MGRGKDTGLRGKKLECSSLFCDLKRVTASLTLGFPNSELGLTKQLGSVSVMYSVDAKPGC